MHHVVNLRGGQEKKIRELIQQCRVVSIQEFIEVAIDNQLQLEVSEGQDLEHRAISSPGGNEVAEISSSTWERLTAIPETRPPVYQAVGVVDPTTHVLWAQYYRWIPLKTVVRVLANMSTKGTVKYANLVANVAQTALSLGNWLRANEGQNEREGRLASGFPTSKDASIERFRQHYVANYRPGQRTSGFPVELGLITVFDREGEVVVGLTKAGAIFAIEHNPVLDDKKSEATLSSTEQLFIVEHIRRNLPKEFEVMKSVLDGIRGGLDTPTKLDNVCRSVYGKDAQNWTAGHLTSMRAGVVSRVSELGLLSREWTGRNVKYKVTEDGLAILAGQLERLSETYRSLLASYEVVA